MNTSEFLNITALIVPDRPAVVFDGRTITFQELVSRVNRLADVLQNAGVTSGDRVATIQVNCNEHIEAYFASALLDAVYVPVNFRSTAEEIHYMISDSSARVVISGSRYIDLVDSIRSDLHSVSTYIGLDGTDKKGWLNYDEAIRGAIDDPKFPEGDDEDLTMVMFTAGTTGSPKGVMLSHDSFSSYILSNVSPADIEESEKNILTVPMYHIAGIQAVMAAIYGGRTLIIQRQFEPVEWMSLVQSEQAN